MAINLPITNSRSRVGDGEGLITGSAGDDGEGDASPRSLRSPGVGLGEGKEDDDEEEEEEGSVLGCGEGGSSHGDEGDSLLPPPPMTVGCGVAVGSGETDGCGVGCGVRTAATLRSRKDGARYCATAQGHCPSDEYMKVSRNQPVMSSCS